MAWLDLLIPLLIKYYPWNFQLCKIDSVVHNFLTKAFLKWFFLHSFIKNAFHKLNHNAFLVLSVVQLLLLRENYAHGHGAEAQHRRIHLKGFLLVYCVVSYKPTHSSVVEELPQFLPCGNEGINQTQRDFKWFLGNYCIMRWSWWIGIFRQIVHFISRCNETLRNGYIFDEKCTTCFSIGFSPDYQIVLA